MSEGTRLDLIDAQLRALQAEQRTLRIEKELIRKDLFEVSRVVSDRIASFEAFVEQRFDQLHTQIARIGKS